MKLNIIDKLFKDFDDLNIRYCHWKSNELLEASVSGNTDLDVLFDKSQQEEVVQILKRNKYHLFEAVWYRKYSGIVDYIGFDKETGKIVHVHTHFNLDIGEVGIKSYHLPWEKLILDNRVYDDHFKIYKSSPEMEYLLLIVRTAFKYDLIDSKSNHKIARHFDKEAGWLYNQIKLEEVKRLSLDILGNEITDLITQICHNKNYDQKLFITLKKLLQPYFSKHRILSPLKVILLKAIHFLKRIEIKSRTILRLPIEIKKRSLPHQGVILCIMGADGAGKSTQTKEIVRELKIKVDGQFIYMGSGDGKKSAARTLFRKLIQASQKFSLKATEKNKAKQKKNGDEDIDLQKLPLKNKIIIFVNAILIANEKRSRLKKARKARSAGKIVVCDRYPQISVLGYNDSPKLHSYLNSPNSILRLIARYEFSCYRLAGSIRPDLVIKLIGNVETLHNRRPEMTFEEISKKQDGILNLKFNAPTNVLILDIEKPIYQLKGMILDAVSDQITKQNSL